MASFVETVKVLIDMDTKNASGAFKGLQSDIGDLQAKVKGSGGGIFSAISENASVALAGAGAAVGAFAVKAVDQFQNLALSVDNFVQKTGTSADAASRWVEVSKDLSVSTDAVAAAFGRVAREDAAGKLNEFGLAAGTTSDRFAELLSKIGAIPDENARAAAAFKVFGRSWQELAPLLDSTEKIKDRLAETPKGHLISEGDIKAAREFRDNMDDLHDAIESVVNVAGRELVGVINSLVSSIRDAAGPISKLVSGLNDFGNSLDDALGGALSSLNDFGATLFNEVFNPVTQFGHLTDAVGAGVDALTTGFGLWGDSADDAAKKVEASTAAQFRAVEGFDAGTVAADASAEANKYAAAAADTLNKMLDAQKKKYDDLAKAQNDQVTAQRGVGDATIAVGKATDDYTTFLAGLNKETADAKGNQEKLNDINREAVGHAGDLADAIVNLHTQQAEANGQTIGAVEKFDLWGHSMIDSAAKLKGPLQDAVLGYIGQVNDIPEDRLTEIKADIAAGDLEKAKQDLDAASAARTAAIIAEADTQKANQDLDAAAHERFVRYTAIASGNFVARAAGGMVAPGTLALVGERGPELAVFADGGYVYTAAETTQMMAAVSGLRKVRGFATGGDIGIPEAKGYPGDFGTPGGETGVVIGAGLIGTPPPGENRYNAFGFQGVGGSADIIGMGTGPGYTGPFLPVPGIPGRNLKIPEQRDYGTMIVVNVNGTVTDPVKAGQQIVEVIKRYESSAGTAWRN